MSFIALNYYAATVKIDCEFEAGAETFDDEFKSSGVNSLRTERPWTS